MRSRRFDEVGRLNLSGRLRRRFEPAIEWNIVTAIMNAVISGVPCLWSQLAILASSTTSGAYVATSHASERKMIPATMNAAQPRKSRPVGERL